MPATVRAEGLTKSFGDVQALRGIDLEVNEGSVFGLLGPNGAGKTTAIRILTTLLRPTGGKAMVAGFDVLTQPQAVRSAIGLTGQFAAVDEDLTGRENLVLIGRLGHLQPRRARRRADELLEQFELSDAANRLVRTYSGGMRRRLDVAASLVSEPALLFLDEPTTGLDPRSRFALWEVIEALSDAGTTIVLTTQYLEEADRLADRISVIDEGVVIAEGTPEQLKAKVGGAVLDVVVARRARLATAAKTLARAFAVDTGEFSIDKARGSLSIPVRDGTTALVDAVRALDASRVAIADLALHRPSLDNVFLALTGHRAVDAEEAEIPPGTRRRSSPRTQNPRLTQKERV